MLTILQTEWSVASPGNVNVTVEGSLESVGPLQRIGYPVLSAGARFQAILVDLRCQVSFLVLGIRCLC